MIIPPGRSGVAFSDGEHGDLRSDHSARARFSRGLGIPAHWATVTQVHGRDVGRADHPGDLGEADAIWTTTQSLPLAVFTADCFGVVIGADRAVGIAHAGWRGTEAGVAANLRSTMEEGGHDPRWAAIGPGIRECCFEVGPEVAERFSGYASHTDWGSLSVDLISALRSQLNGLELWISNGCTYHGSGWFSHRRSRAEERMATVGWLP